MIPEEADLEGFFMAVGHVAQSWAMVEQNFDMWIAMIYHALGGREEIDERLPVSFKRKADFLRRAFNQIATLKKHASQAIPLVATAQELSKKRNDLVHGVLVRADTKKSEWHMVIFDYESPKDRKNWHVLRSFIFSPRKFKTLEPQFVDLAEKVAAFGLHLKHEELGG